MVLKHLIIFVSGNIFPVNAVQAFQDENIQQADKQAESADYKDCNMIIRHRRQNVVNFFAQKGEEEEADAGDGKKVFDRPVDIFIQVCNLQQRHCYLAD